MSLVDLLEDFIIHYWSHVVSTCRVTANRLRVAAARIARATTRWIS